MSNVICDRLKDVSFDAVFGALSHRACTVLLDSSDSMSSKSRYSILAAAPFAVFETRFGVPMFSTWQGKLESFDSKNPFDVLDELLARFDVPDGLSELPFCGGALGYVGYESARFLSDFSHIWSSESLSAGLQFPDMWFGFYHCFFVYDHINATLDYVSFDVPECRAQALSFDSFRERYFLDNSQSFPSNAFRLTSDIVSNLTQQEYVDAVQRAKDYIYEGDIYQVNMSQRFSAKYKGDIVGLYESVRRHSPAPFSAYFHLGEQWLLSTSPERFFSIRDGVVQTSPIKGTCSRGDTPDEDAVFSQSLYDSSKDTAELMMIVDLERNDLGRVCEYGSVSVPSLKSVESYAQVFHLVATVEGRLKSGLSQVDVFKALFPGGSITGAPKRRSMEIIQDLETVPRVVFTGAIGYFGFDGNCDFNIAIRTLYASAFQLYFHAGGGIVSDSDPLKEWEESCLKASGFRVALEQFGGV